VHGCWSIRFEITLWHSEKTIAQVSPAFRSDSKQHSYVNSAATGGCVLCAMHTPPRLPAHAHTHHPSSSATPLGECWVCVQRSYQKPQHQDTVHTCPSCGDSTAQPTPLHAQGDKNAEKILSCQKAIYSGKYI